MVRALTMSACFLQETLRYGRTEDIAEGHEDGTTLFVVLLIRALPAQELEPLANPAQLSSRQIGSDRH